MRRGATLGANCTIRCGVTIGDHAFVAAGAVVTRDVLPYAIVLGNPALLVGWACTCGERLDLPATGSAQAPRVRCGVAWSLDDGSLSPAQA